MRRHSLPVWSEHSLSSVESTQLELSLRFNDNTHTGGQIVSCRPGCDNCCYHPVHLSSIEGVLLYRKLISRGLWSPKFKAKVTEHAQRTTDLTYEVWLLSLLPCPLLNVETKRCVAYKDRPFPCRVTVSVGDREACHPHRIAEAEILNKHDISREFYAEVSKLIRRHGITLIIMPISVALLIGESIDRGEVTLEASDMAVLKRYVETRS